MVTSATWLHKHLPWTQSNECKTIHNTPIRDSFSPEKSIIRYILDRCVSIQMIQWYQALWWPSGFSQNTIGQWYFIFTCDRTYKTVLYIRCKDSLQILHLSTRQKKISGVLIFCSTQSAMFFTYDRILWIFKVFTTVFLNTANSLLIAR